MRRQYELTVRQEPKQARMCGIGGKADRRPIDPPIIVQLRVIDPAAAASSSAGPNNNTDPSSHDAEDNSNNPDSDDPPYTHLPSYAQSFLQNPYYFMFASLAKPDDDTELHWLKDGRTRCTTGSVVSSLYALKDPTGVPSTGNLTASAGVATTTGAGAKEGAGKDGGPTTAPPPSDAGFFVFPDLSVRTEGSYRLKLSLFEVVGNDVRHCKSIYSAPFYVYTAKKFPGVEESSPLTCSLADQGIKIPACGYALAVDSIDSAPTWGGDPGTRGFGHDSERADPAPATAAGGDAPGYTTPAGCADAPGYGRVREQQQ
ncbi:velvet factor-domain-containing protein [Mycena filopes]|nr:velvet factor-domain-containing protein [Mycena filopes]